MTELINEQDIKTRIDFINKTFVRDKVQTSYTGKNIDTSGNNTFLDRILDRYDFEKTYKLRKINGNPYHIYKRENANELYRTIRDRRYNYYTLNDKMNGSYNLYFFNRHLLGAGTADRGINRLLDYLTVTYNLLDNNTFKEYLKKKKSGSKKMDTRINRYFLRYNRAGSRQHVLVTIKHFEWRVNKIINLKALVEDTRGTQLEAIRRVILMYINLIHMHILQFALTKTPKSNVNNKTWRVELYNVLSNIHDQVVAYNNELDNIGGNHDQILKSTQARFNRYKKLKDSVNEENDELLDNKVLIGNTKNKYSASKGYSNKAKILVLSYIVLFMIIVVPTLSVSYNLSLNYETKKLVVAVMLGGAILTYMGSVFIKNRVLTYENFSNMYVEKNMKTINEYEASEINDYLNKLYVSVGREFVKYLDHTITTSLILDSYNLYGDVNHSISKELDYYENINYQLKNENSKLEQAKRINYYDAYINRIRITFFVSILLTITISAFVSSYFPGSLSLVSVVMLIAILILTYIYIMNVNNLVRTDGKKLYWGQPSKNMF
jgi:uncharacterized membrane protein YbaN (DUF454 family)